MSQCECTLGVYSMLYTARCPPVVYSRSLGLPTRKLPDRVVTCCILMSQCEAEKSVSVQKAYVRVTCTL